MTPRIIDRLAFEFIRFAVWLNTGDNGLNLTGAITVPIFLVAIIATINAYGGHL